MEGHNQRSDYGCNFNARSICHLSHQITSIAALSKYLTEAYKWKIIAKCPGTLIQSVILSESITAP